MDEPSSGPVTHDVRREFGAVLRANRLKLRPDVTTIARFADLMNYSKDYVSGVETGSHWPSVEFVRLYETVCGVVDGSLVALHGRLAKGARTETSTDTGRRAQQFRRIAGALFMAAVFLAGGTMVAQRSASTPVHGAIVAPTEGRLLCYETAVTGAFGGLPDGHDLWLIVRPRLTGLYYPQPGPIAHDGSGARRRFFGSAYLGEPDKGVGEAFEILLVSALPEVSRTLAATHHTHSGLGGLPVGARQLDAVSVARNPC